MERLTEVQRSVLRRLLEKEFRECCESQSEMPVCKLALLSKLSVSPGAKSAADCRI